MHDFLYIATDDAGNADSCAFTITQYPLPVADAGSDQTITAPNPATLGGDPSTANGGTAPYSFLWFPAADLDDNTTEHPVASPSSTTDYIVFAIDDNGCAGTGGMTLTVNPAFENEGSDKVESLGVEVWPNPANSSFWVTFDAFPEGKTVVELFDIMGRQLRSDETDFRKNQPVEIGVSKLQPGMYILQISNGPIRMERKLTVYR